MLARILHPSPKLCVFLDPLIESLSKPQRAHLRELCDAIIVCETEHTIAALQRLFVETTDPSNWADFLRISPWQPDAVRADLLKSQIDWALEQGQKSSQAKEIYLNFDDSLGQKDDATWRLDVVDWHHDHTSSTPGQPRYKNAFCYLACTMCVGDLMVTLDVRLYLRARTVRAVNRKRAPDERIRFRSKNTILRQMLQRIAPLLPPDWEVIVQFDSWYAAKKVLKFVHRQKWHFTCGVKANRKLDGVRLNEQNRKETHKWHTRVRVTNAKKEERFYFVRQLDGRLEEIPFDLRVLISKRHTEQKNPAYFASTRDCKPQAILQGYSGRWSCEVVNFYLKVQLGLADFRLWCYEAVDKYVVAVHLAWAYLERRYVEEGGTQIKTYGDLIRRHREEHAESLLKAAVGMALEGATLDQVLQRFLSRDSTDTDSMSN
ncbi:MAG: transposase [Blastocatellia bacterium]|nr:transposase [Blastocatellia bacterium]